MDIASYVRGIAISLIWSLLVPWHVATAAPLSVAFDNGDFVIMDNDPLFDKDPREAIITFDIFVAVQGYSVIGTATQFSDGTFTQIANSAQTALDLNATRPGNVGNGAVLVLNFEGFFAGNFAPPSPDVGFDVFRGQFVNVLNNNLGGGNTIRARGFVNNIPIDPLFSTGNNEPFNFTAVANAIGQSFGDGHGPMQFTFGPDASPLTGTVVFSLGAFDRLDLSALVFLNHINLVPEPVSLFLFISGLVGLVVIAWRRPLRGKLIVGSKPSSPFKSRVSTYGELILDCRHFLHRIQRGRETEAHCNNCVHSII
jgi:hypothetical protein